MLIKSFLFVSFLGQADSADINVGAGTGPPIRSTSISSGNICFYMM